MSYHFPRLAISEGILLNLAMDCFGPSLDFLVFNVGFYNCFCPHVTTLSCISQNKKKLMHHFSASAHSYVLLFPARPIFRLMISISEDLT